MFAKILIKGKIETVTGMHIGTGGAYSAIGTADSIVVKDVLSGDPIIPGSSLKGKLRTLMAKKYNTNFASTPENDDKRIRSLFGCMGKDANNAMSARLTFSDMILSEESKKMLRNKEIYSPLEVKSENTINRVTSQANPRQIERVIRGCVFDMNIIYTVYDKNGTESVTNEEIISDFEMLADGFKMLEYDYLGGNGSRGYGKVKFTDLKAEIAVVNDGVGISDVVEKCSGILRDV